jgi:hypothetical protein
MPLGPHEQIPSVVTGERTSAFFVGQPEGFPLQDHLLVVSCDSVHVPKGITEPTLLFVGGADSDEVGNPGDPASPSDYLAVMYPVTERSELEKTIGSIDFRPASEQEAP